MHKFKGLKAIIAICSMIFGITSYESYASPQKVLVVMSYELNNPWSMEIKEGIDSVLAEQYHIEYFYMDTKINLKNGHQKAKEAFSLYQKLNPVGVITADDNAQSMFVLPYLKNKIKIPLMFCGVNADAAEYGYPTNNISGVLERGHIGESIAFAKQLIPSFNSIGVLTKESPSGRALFQQIEKESDNYFAKVVAFESIKNEKELISHAKMLQKKVDVIYIDSLEGIKSTKGLPLHNKAIINILKNHFKKPIIGANLFHVQAGVLSAVVKTGQEQGRSAALMLLKAMQGTAVSEIPVAKNYRGRRFINVNSMIELGIKPKPSALLGARLIKTND